VTAYAIPCGVLRGKSRKWMTEPLASAIEPYRSPSEQWAYGNVRRFFLGLLGAAHIALPKGLEHWRDRAKTL
jgi:hypothetical protein